MKTTKLIYACLAGLLLVLSGCSKEYPEDLLLGDTSTDHKELLALLESYTYPGDLPEFTLHLKGAAVTKTIKFKRVSGIYHNYDPGLIGAPQKYISGQGIASHLGNFSVVNTILFTGEQNSDGSPVYYIFGTTTAANGDELNSVMIWVQPVDEMMEFTYKVLGGSGRFEGASGSIVLQGYLYLDSWSLSGEGEITF